MSWISRLHETYDSCKSQEGSPPWPLSHFVKNAHIEVVLNSAGEFQSGRTRILSGSESATLIPATESSAGKAGAKIAPHPLCEELGYCASDLPNVDQKKVDAYIRQMDKWANSEFTHSKVKIIYKYLKNGTLYHDLLNDQVRFPISFKSKSGQISKVEDAKTFIRWRVEEAGNLCSATWEDEDLIQRWIKFDEKYYSTDGFCYALGHKSRVSHNHSRFIRYPGDGAKLISSNDDKGFTYLGKFMDSSQSVEVGFEVTQKAHNALRWLISRQGFYNGDQVVVAWAISGKSIPRIMNDVHTELDLSDFSVTNTNAYEDKYDESPQDMGQLFAIKLKKKLMGYRTDLKNNENIIVMALDSATPGRMSITYYREFFAQEFFDQLESWYNNFAWPQRYSELTTRNKTKISWHVSTPTPKFIAEAAYGKTLTDPLKKNLIERILPCIVEEKQIPFDILNLCIKRASNPASCEHWQWEQNIGIACALYRGFFKRHPDKKLRKEYSMTLEINNTSRDYLYGRLLAVAEYIEQIALNISGEKRSTNAERLMQRFADNPFSSWRTLRLALNPYIERLRNNRPGFLVNRQKELDLITSSFNHDDFTNDKKLSGEFLLGYHCQRQSHHPEKDNNTNNDTD